MTKKELKDYIEVIEKFAFKQGKQYEFLQKKKEYLKEKNLGWSVRTYFTKENLSDYAECCICASYDIYRECP